MWCSRGGGHVALESIVLEGRDLDASQYFVAQGVTAVRHFRHELHLGRAARPGGRMQPRRVLGRRRLAFETVASPPLTPDLGLKRFSPLSLVLPPITTLNSKGRAMPDRMTCPIVLPTLQPRPLLERGRWRRDRVPHRLPRHEVNRGGTGEQPINNDRRLAAGPALRWATD